MKVPETTRAKVISWIAALAMTAIFILMPEWSLLFVFVISLVLVFFLASDGLDPNDIAFAFKACWWGIGLLTLEAMIWWLLGGKYAISLQDALVPSKDTPYDYRLALFGWGSIFVGMLQGIRYIFHATFGKQA